MQFFRKIWSNTLTRFGIIGFIGVSIFGLLSFLAGTFLPVGLDWRDAYLPAIRLVLQGQSPYHTGWFYNPPWLIPLLIPFALLPLKYGFGAMMIIGFAAFGYLAYRLSAKPITMVFYLLSLPVLICVTLGNIDWLALLGILMPGPIGMIFMVIKPQATFGVIILWTWLAWRENKLHGIVRLYLPLLGCLILSFLIFGFWPIDTWMAIQREKIVIDNSLWPMAVPIGLILLVKGLKKRKLKHALASSPFLSPYTFYQSFSGALLSLSDSTLEMAVAVIGMYMVRLL